MKKITFTRKSNWNDAGCYNDIVDVIDTDSINLYEGSARTWPNPVQPTSGKPAPDAYGAVCPGSYQGKFFTNYSPREPFIRCIEISGGGALPCMWPNVNHNNELIVAGVFIHHGQTAEWSGSAACMTIPPINADEFWSIFADQEIVGIVIANV